METKAMQPQEQRPVPVLIDILPANMEAEIEKARMARVALEKLFKTLLVQGTDFDRVPGTDKPTLLKSGAELLCQVFHLAPGKPEMISCQEDYQTGILSYTIGTPIYHRETGILVAYGIGAANSKEPKYRYRRSKDDPEIRVENPDPAAEQNTLVKMAAKRSLVDGVLKATGASRMFTQDVEDYMLPEKASSKQVNYIKSLYRGMKDEEILADVGQILGREVKAWDITREEASQVIEARKAQPANGNGQKRSIPDAPRPAARGGGRKKEDAPQAGLNWSAFWTPVRNDLGMDQESVHEEARRYFGKPDLKSLAEVVTDQQTLDDFLAYLREMYGAVSLDETA